MRVSRIERYTIGWTPPVGMYKIPPQQVLSHIREVLVPDGDDCGVTMIHNDEIHGVKNGYKQSEVVEGITTGA